MFKTEPVPGLNGRALNYPRGKVIGGSSSINAMIYMRGQSADYDHWRQLGLTGWGWDDVLPYFKRHENHFLGDERHHGAGGEWRDRAAARALGSARRLPRRGRAGRHQIASPTSTPATTRARRLPRQPETRPALVGGDALFSSRRSIAATCGSKPAAWSKASCSTDKRAVGVRWRQNGETRSARCRGEVILAAGAIGSPQTHAAVRRRARPSSCASTAFPVVLDRPGVGANLQDHLQLRMIYKVDGIADAQRALLIRRSARRACSLEYALFRRAAR